jgi:hypothetical protein
VAEAGSARLWPSMGHNGRVVEERRADTNNRSRLDRIDASYKRWSSRTLLLLACLAGFQLVLGVLAIYLVGQNNDRIDENKANIAAIRRIADRASDKAEAVRLGAVLAKEKVCTDTNRKVACRALFDRLATSLSDAQRFQLACAVVVQLRGDVARELESSSKCPKP